LFINFQVTFIMMTYKPDIKYPKFKLMDIQHMIPASY